ncbi:MAG TPA: hypothetical protein VLK78_07115, partial [Candidatus Angelobacter sp.]|nr:hypothetical protein [Candidatus Angelobacter sp.]
TKDDQGEDNTSVEADDQNEPKQQEDEVKDDVKQAAEKVTDHKSSETKPVKKDEAKAKAKVHKLVTKAHDEAKKVKSHVEKKVNNGRHHQVNAQTLDKAHGFNHSAETTVSVHVGSHSHSSND